jgi:hypothetical protein
MHTNTFQQKQEMSTSTVAVALAHINAKLMPLCAYLLASGQALCIAFN